MIVTIQKFLVLKDRDRASTISKDPLKNASSFRKMSFVSDSLLLQKADNAKIKSSLSSLENPEISNDLNQIISLLPKNYNDMNSKSR